MTNKILLNAEEVAEILGISKPHAYKLIKGLNDELKSRGYITVAGKISRKYFEEKVYGGEQYARV